MTEEATLAELNKQIQKLTEQRDNITNKQIIGEEATIKQLQWTKHCHGTLQINTLTGAGLATYIITLSGPRIPSSFTSVTVMGDSKFYEDNMLFRHGVELPTFYTSSLATLIKFLSVAEFKTFSYDEDHLRALMAARDKSGKHTADVVCVEDPEHKGTYFVQTRTTTPTKRRKKRKKRR